MSEEEPNLAPHEKLVICPNCKNKTLLINDFVEYNTCVNINCGYWKKKENKKEYNESNYIDSYDYGDIFDMNYNLGKINKSKK